jgi:hypothetical protein
MVGLLPKRPQEVLDRILAIAEYQWERLNQDRPDYQLKVKAFDEAIHELGVALGVEIEPFLAENQNHEIEWQVRERIDLLRSVGPFNLLHNADFLLTRLAYAMCRALKPNVVVETGIAYGVSTAFVLKALDVNRNGKLHSVDLPLYEGSRFNQKLKRMLGL